jgi:hypothetical protein
MSRSRQAQWAHRLQRLQDRFVCAHRYERAYKASLTVQRLYDRWADEVFATYPR